MVDHKVFFGVKLTDNFGGYLSQYRSLLKLLSESDLESFPSAESDQLVLGFSVSLTKNEDISNLERRWSSRLDRISAMSDEIKVELEKAGITKDSADYVVVSGKY